MKHVKYFFTRKYLLFLLPLIIGIVISGYMLVREGGSYLDDGKAASGFVPETEEYSSVEELEALLNKTRQTIATMDKEDEKYENFRIKLAWYEYLYSNKIEYDEIASYNGSRKFGKFSMLDNFSEPVFILVYLSSIIIGALLITFDFQIGTAKLVYSSGESKLKILFSRYAISVASLTAVILIIEVVYVSIAGKAGGVSEIGLMSDYTIKAYSFGEYAAISVLSVIVNFWIIYTVVYFACAVFHNSVIPICGAMLAFVFIMFLRNSGSTGGVWNTFLDSSVYGVLRGVYKNGDNPTLSDFLIYLVNVFFAAVISAVGTTVFYMRDIL